MSNHATGPTIVDGHLKNWGDRLHYKGRKGRKAPKSHSRPVFAAHSKLAPKIPPRSILMGIVKKSPQVMVKITGRGRGPGHVGAHLSYIARSGKLELEDNKGRTVSHKDTIKAWSTGPHPIQESAKARQSFNVVLSMPHGTDAIALRAAAQNFASDTFPANEYVMALHTEDDRPHVHLCIKAVDRTGKRLNPRKADLQQWREGFAEHLNEQGIDAAASPRHSRGVTKRPEKSAVYHRDKAYKQGKSAQPSRTTVAKFTDISLEVLHGKKHINPHEAAIQNRREKTVQGYEQLVAALSGSAEVQDRELGVLLKQFTAKFPASETLHQSRLGIVKGHIARSRQPIADRSRKPLTLETDKDVEKDRDIER